ncbi:MAG: hypothetical protein RSE00_03330 [Clostridia bacterium]
MKNKSIVFSIMFIVMFCTVPFVKGATSQDILNYCKQSHVVAGKTVTVSNADIVKIERFLNTNPITAAQGDTIIANAKAAITVMDKAGVSDISKLNSADRQKILGLLNNAGSAVGVTFDFDAATGSIKVFKDGKQIETINGSTKLPFTGSANVSYIAVSAIIVAAIAMFVVKKEGLLNSAK